MEAFGSQPDGSAQMATAMVSAVLAFDALTVLATESTVAGCSSSSGQRWHGSRPGRAGHGAVAYGGTAAPARGTCQSGGMRLRTTDEQDRSYAQLLADAKRREELCAQTCRLRDIECAS